MAFDVEGARTAGYSDTEIADHLSSEAKFDAPAARKAGYTDAELIKQLAGAPPAASNGVFGDKPLISLSGHELPSRSHIGEALAEGWRSAPTFVDPATNPVLGAVNLPLQFANSLFRGGQQFVEEALSPISPQLGRDVAAIPEAFMGSPHPVVGETVRIPRVEEVVPAVRNAVGPRIDPMVARVGEVGQESRPPAPSPLTAEGQAAARYANESAAPPAEPAPPPTGAAPPSPVAAEPPPAPAAAGADITRGPIPEPDKTAAQVAFEKDVRQTAADRAGPQGVDHTAYLPGAQRTEAAREFSPEASVHEDALAETDPKFAAKVLQLENDAKKIADDTYKEQAGDKNTHEAAIETRRQFSPDELGVFAKEAPTALGGEIEGRLRQLLASPEGKRSGVRSVLESVLKGFLDADGNPEIMPSMIYGGRKNISDWLDRAAIGTGTEADSARAAKHFLVDLLHEYVDPAINDGAPLFETFRSKWTELSKPIDRMEFLQQHMFGPGSIYGADKLPQYGKIQKLLEKMVKFQNASGTNPVKAFEPEHLSQLIAIRNELEAWHYRDLLKKSAGSNTVKRATAAANLQSGPLGKAIQYGSEALAQGAALAVAPGWGNVALLAARPAIKRAIDSRAAKKLQAVKDRMIETAPRNQLSPPGS